MSTEWKGRKAKFAKPDQYGMDFGSWVELLRSQQKPRGWSKNQLSAHIQVSPQYMNVIENEKKIPQEDVIQKLIDAFNLTGEAERYTWFLADTLPPKVIEQVKREYFAGIENSVKRIIDGG